MARVIVIDSENQQISVLKRNSLEQYQQIVGGLIERVTIFENGDELYANEEGTFFAKTGFFIRGYVYPVYGNAFIIGAEDSTGCFHDAATALLNVCEMVSWCSFVED